VKTIIKLLIAIALINAVVRTGLVAVRYYELKDAVQQLVTFSADAAPNDIQNHIMEKAEELQVPLNYDDVDVTRDGPRTIATASYTEPIELFPSYQYPYTFSFSVEGLSLNRVPSAARPANR
jgi:hypothetical protein